MDLSKLFEVPTTDEIVESFWQAANISPSKVRPLGLLNQVVYGFAIGCSALWRACQNITLGLGDIRTSRGVWLDTIALGFYDIERRKPAPTVGTVSVVTTGVTTLITLQNLQSGVQYKWAGSVAAGTFALEFVAQEQGEIGNCSINDLVCITSGVTISPYPTNPLALKWITRLGLDEETDDQLIQRCLDIVRQRGGTSGEAIAAKLRLLTDGQIQRVFVAYSVDASVYVYIASANGLVTDSVKTLAQSNINLYTSPFVRNATVYDPPVVEIKLVGELSFQQGTSQSTITDIRNQLAAWGNSLPLVSNTNDGSVLILSDITRKLNQIDSANVLRFASFIAICNNSRVTGMIDPLPAPPGSMYRFNLDNLKTVYR